MLIVRFLFVLAMIMLATQTVNLGHLRFFENKAAALHSPERPSPDDVQEAKAEEDREIAKVHYYCGWGLIFTVFGYFIYVKVNRLLGLSFLIAGFCELIGYTGLLMRYPQSSFAGLLNVKLAYSLLSIALLLFIAYLIDALQEMNAADKQG